MSSICGELRRLNKCSKPLGLQCIIWCNEAVKLNRIKRKLEKLSKNK